MKQYSDPLESKETQGCVKLRYEWIVSKLKSINPHKVLDIGCGLGFGTNMIHNAGFSVIGMDFSKTAIKTAKSRYPHIDFMVRNATCLNGKYDAIVAGEIIEHLEDWEQALQHWKNHLNPGGTILLTTPNAKYGGRITPERFRMKINPCHVKEFSYDEIREISPRVWGINLMPITTKPITLLFGGDASTRFRAWAGRHLPRFSQEFLVEIIKEKGNRRAEL